MDWRAPFISTILYLIYVQHMNAKLQNAVAQKRKTFSFLTLSMVIHNLSLALFSMHVFKNCALVIYRRFSTVDIRTFCIDIDNTILNDIQYWSWIFYVSKIYEVIDTVIVHLNSKPSLFLQYYHHTGAIFATYFFSKAQSHLSWIFVVLNSFVHSIMYLYYLVSVFGIRLRFKKIITAMQMTQFIVGYILLGLHFVFGYRLSTERGLKILQVFTISFNISYVLVLFVLFKVFFQKTYHKKGKLQKKISESDITENVIMS